MFYANVRPAQAPSGKTPQHHSTGVFTQGDFEFKHASKSNVSSNIATDVALVASSSLCELKAMAAFSVCCLVLDKLKKLVIFLSRIWVGRTDENCPPSLSTCLIGRGVKFGCSVETMDIWQC